MKQIKRIDSLPKPIRALAKAFYEMDVHSPGIFEATDAEMIALKDEEEVIFQLIFDREFQKWYLVAAGDPERKIMSEYIYHDPYHIKRSILCFQPVNEAWIRNRRREYDEHMIYEKERVWTGKGWL